VSPVGPSLDPGLQALLTALGEAGLPVGVRELERLHRVFSLAPALGGAGGEVERRLGAVLRAVLVHRQEDRATFDRVYGAWLGQTAAALRVAGEGDISTLLPRTSPPGPGLRGPAGETAPRGPPAAGCAVS
jgi:uncharacterized protein with von Willebrand factor type A (vWA) domain